MSDGWEGAMTGMGWEKNGWFKRRCGEEQKRLPYGQENEYKSKLIEVIKWGSSQEETETWHIGGTQESFGMPLVMTPYMGDIEPEEDISSNQAGTPGGKWIHQPMHKTFKPKFILSARNIGMGDSQCLEEWPNNNEPT